MGKAEELVQAHQEYQRGLHVFEAWLEQEQEKLGCYTQLEGDVETLEETLQKLQVRTRTYCYLQIHSQRKVAFPMSLILRDERQNYQPG